MSGVAISTESLYIIFQPRLPILAAKWRKQPVSKGCGRGFSLEFFAPSQAHRG